MKRYPLFCWHREPGFLWFRVLGYGACIKDASRFGLTFSQRMGLEAFLRVGKYLIEPLRPWYLDAEDRPDVVEPYFEMVRRFLP